MAGIFGKGAADDFVESIAKRLAKNETAQNAFVKIANSLGEGFEEFLTEFATRITNEVIVDTDDRSVLQTMGDAGYNALMGAIVGGVVQTADGMIKSVRSDPKALAQQAADAAIAQFKAQTGDAAKPTLAQQIDSMRQQLADMQHRQKVDSLMAVYEENVGAIENGLLLDKEVDEQIQTQLSEIITSEETKEIDDNLDFKFYSSQLTGISTSTGVQMEAVTLHAYERLKSRGVPASSIVEALTVPLDVGTIKENRSQVFIGEHATTIINVDTGKIITVWPTHAKKAKKLKGGE